MSFLRFHRAIRIRLLLLFLTTMSTMTVMPYLIIYLSDQVGTFVAGFLFLGVMVANVLGSVLGGFISDRVGRKKIILWTELIICLCFACAAWAITIWLSLPYIIFFLFVFIQFCSGAASPVYQALIIDISTPEERRSIYTYSYWLRNLAIAIGSMIGAFLFFEFLFQLFLGVALCTLLSLIITFFFIQETYVPVQEKTPSNSGTKQMMYAYRNVLAHKFFMVFSIASFLIVSVEEQLTNYIGLRLANEIQEPIPFLSFLPLHVNGINLLGILKAENTLLVVFLTAFIAWAARKMNERFVILGGLLLFFAGYTVISFSTTPFILIIAMLVASVGEIMYIPVKQTMLANIVPDHARSTYMAFYSIATIIGVSAAGVFMIISNWVPPIALTSIIGIIGAVSILLFFKLTKSHSLKEGKEVINQVQ